MGDEASYPPPGLDSKKMKKGWTAKWTACPHVEIGGTLFFYYMAPRKAIHYVGRAISRPYVDTSLKAMSHRDVHRHQWWIDYDSVVQIDPIPLSNVNKACGERLNLRGRNGKPIRTDAANRLLRQATVTYPSTREKTALKAVVGRSELPLPSKITLPILRELSSSSLRLESHVEEFVLEPLFRLLRLPSAYSRQRRLRIERKIADYAILLKGKPHCIIEAKLRTSLDRDRHWSNSPDVQQAKGYASGFAARFIVVDCDEVFCFHPGKSIPCLTFSRRDLTHKNLMEIRSHVMGFNSRVK